MVFSSLTFLLFLAVFLVIYFAIPWIKGKNIVLFVFSLLFYSWGEPVYMLLMVFSVVFNFVCGLFVDKYRGKTASKIALIVSVTVDIGMLGVFKYCDFFISSVNAVTGWNIPLTKLALPIGISFYTFQIMSYTIDVYRGDAKVQKSIIAFGDYVMLFPQLIAGPIVRYQTIADQLNYREHSWERFGLGVKRFAVGFGKKILLANNIGLIWSQISAQIGGSLTVVGVWLGILAFGLQLYFDFSGYSDMAIGLGKMLGFDFLENFDYPYISQSVTEFWRRWHISLGTWFRDYVYIPLGGNRRGTAVQLRNIAIVWLLTGFWHGASWNYVLWGVFYGVLLIAEKFGLLKVLKKAPAAVGHIYTLFVVAIGWTLFAVEDMSKLGICLKTMFGGAAFADKATMYLLVTSLPLLAIGILACTPLAKKCYGFVNAKAKALPMTVLDCVGVTVVFVLGVAYLIAGSYNPFLYFRF